MLPFHKRGYIIEILGFLIELALQLLAELLGSVGYRSLEALFLREPHPVFAALGYGLLGLVFGGLSLWLFPSLFIAAKGAQLLNLLLLPPLAGLAMSCIGRRAPPAGQAPGAAGPLWAGVWPLRWERFARGFLFALSMALLRFVFANHG